MNKISEVFEINNEKAYYLGIECYTVKEPINRFTGTNLYFAVDDCIDIKKHRKQKLNSIICD